MVRSGMRGSRIGARPRGENERRASVARAAVTFFSAIGHSTSPIFAATAEVPETWDCRDCDRPAGVDPDNPPALIPTRPFRTHLAYVRERRSDADGEAILAEALAKLRATG